MWTNMFRRPLGQTLRPCTNNHIITHTSEFCARANPPPFSGCHIRYIALSAETKFSARWEANFVFIHVRSVPDLNQCDVCNFLTLYGYSMARGFCRSLKGGTFLSEKTH